MADYIDRQYAIEHYQHVCRRTNCKECPLHIQVTDTLTDCELELFLHNLPSADVQPHQLTEEDLTELRHRFGNKVERVVRDMISGKEERWMT